MMVLQAHEIDSRPRVLVIFPGALGDLICLVATLRAIARRHQGASLELMARAELSRFAVGRLGISRAHSIDRREVSNLFADGNDAETRKFFDGFQRIYSFFAEDDARFRQSLASAARCEISFYPFRPPGDAHVAACYLRSIGQDPAATLAEDPAAMLDSRIDLLPADIEAASRRLTNLGLERRRFILLLPGSGSAGKNWPADNFVALAERLAWHTQSLVVLGPAEGALETFFRTRRLATLNQIELGELAALAHLAQAFVGNDSGVSHLAAASGARGVAIFGPTDPARWHPLGQVTVIRSEPLASLGIDQVALGIAKFLD
jgi:heptosyltransferase-3